MGKTTENDNGKSAGVQRRDKKVVDYIDGLSAEHKMLIVLKKQLYGGQWEPMYQDLKNRLAGQPYIFKLANRINDDIERIEQMKLFEKQHNADLCDYIDIIE